MLKGILIRYKGNIIYYILKPNNSYITYIVVV
jgi:hypothetical protein